MKITVNKIKRELKLKYGYNYLGHNRLEEWINDIIKDTIDIIDEQLIIHKNITIKK
jgi:hypothetical protein